MSLLVSFEAVWLGSSFRGPSTFQVRDGLLVPEKTGADADLAVPGTLFPRLTDHHVHLGLIDPRELMPGGITHVIDLGGDPDAVSRLRESAAASPPALPAVHMAGAFLTCVGGYPKGRAWAPDAAVVELADPDDAETAVAMQAAHGASVIKVTLNSAAGPVPSPALLAAVVSAARAEGIPVAAHVEGEGMTLRAIDAGANVLAHTPFDERLDAALVSRIGRTRTAVVSTLDIHGWGEPTQEFEIASDNLRHLAAAGARVLYGTDLGNGPLPTGLNGRELSALAGVGLERDALVASIAGTEHPDAVGSRLAVAPGVPPQTAADTAGWLATATGMTIDQLEEMFA